MTTTPARRIADTLALAAAPTFAAAALATAVATATAPMALCTGGGPLPVTLPGDAMTAMYLLMSLFHLPAWLKRPPGRGRADMTTEGDRP